LIDFGGEGLSYRRLAETVDAARECNFAAISANDHFVFSRPWLDGPTALATVLERSGTMQLVTTLALASLRGPVQLAKALTALDVLSGGRVVAGVGPGSSKADYEVVGAPFEDRWRRFDEAAGQLKAILRAGGSLGDGGGGGGSAVPPVLAPPSPQSAGVPLWVGSWGSAAGLRRVARLGDGWLASAYNTTPEAFGNSMSLLRVELENQGRPSGRFPNALVTMWAWVTNKRADAEHALSGVLGPLLGRGLAQLRDRVCVGSAEYCAELLSRYARGGCQRVHFWPLGDEPRQVELIAGDVMPLVTDS
jgi:alkanesulfonate monooxygenase SsuD/methylene tetrahydromethanopterin reductase-like flavin-dependent oxidoreductase (luciferase family)